MTALLAFVLLAHTAPVVEHPVDGSFEITVAIGTSPQVSRRVQEAALAEAAEIWAPYGVVLNVLPAANHLVAPDIVIVSDERPVRHALSEILASVPIDETHALLPVVEVRYAAIIEMVLGVPGAASAPWQPVVREQLVARALGRVVAHELGHIVLQSTGHGSGLMAPVQADRDLVAADRRRFALSARDALRLRSMGFPCLGSTRQEFFVGSRRSAAGRPAMSS